jgi:hypothetical protein
MLKSFEIDPWCNICMLDKEHNYIEWGVFGNDHRQYTSRNAGIPKPFQAIGTVW